MIKRFLINLSLLNIIFFFIFLIIDSAAVMADLNDGLVAKYSFNGDTQDESANKNDGNVLNGASLTSDRFGNPYSAYSFDGKDDFIKAKADNLPIRERTVALWCSVEKFENHAALVPIGYGGNTCATSFFFYIQKKTFGVAEHCNGNTLHYDDFTEETSGKWYFYAVTTSKNDGSKIFVNGNKVLEDKNTVFGDTYVNGKDLSIGVSTSYTGTAPFINEDVTYFNGKIDDIHIYDRALSELEVIELYNAPNPNPSNINDGLIAYYPFTSNAQDQSGNDNHGTLMENTTFGSDRYDNEKKAILFNGVTDYVNVPHSESLSMNDVVSIAVWVKKG